jgi:F0F1-type ATP synthase alpha subunit
LLKQDQFATMDTSIQTVLLYAGTKGYLDVLSLDQINYFIELASTDLTKFKWPFIETIVATKDFDADAEQSMVNYISDTIEFIQPAE